MINFYFEKKKHKLQVNELVNKNYLKLYIKKNLKKKEVNLNYYFIRSKEQIKLNIEYKDHNYNTDILTFPMLISDCELTGDVYISLKQVKKNSIKYSESFTNELNRVLIHGFLHLSGFNDETNLEKLQMRKEENKYIKYYNKEVPRGTNYVT